MQVELDKTDLEIIEHLREDGRMSYTQIARELGITEGTVRNRVSRLKDENVIQIIGMVDPHRMGYEAPATIGVIIQPPFLEEAAKIIASMPEVSYLILVSGEYDLLVEVMCRDREHLATFLRDKLQKVVGIQRTQTSMILQVYKMAYGAKPVLTTSGQSGNE